MSLPAWNLLCDLYAIPRTLLGEGFEKSLARIRQDVPVEVLRLASGTACGSWTVPPEWQLKRATLVAPSGEVLADGLQNPCAIWQYSTPFTGILSREQLRPHLAASAHTPDGVPQLVTYYTRRWGFSLSARQMQSLPPGDYRVDIQAEFVPGHLSIGTAFLPGRSKQTILIDSVLSASALANNLSGVAAGVALFQALSVQRDRKYSYRWLFTPETLGPIALAYHFPQVFQDAVGGLNLQNLADPGEAFYYKRSRPGNSVFDRSMEHALKHSGLAHEIAEYDVRTGECGNEKAYNSLGIEAPVGAFRRTQLGRYPEYDTSLDDLGFVSQTKLSQSVSLIEAALQVLENNRVLKNTFKGEPFLSGYGLFPKIERDADRLPYDYLMGFADGSQDLIGLAERARLPMERFVEPARLMEEKGLLREVEPG